MKTATSGQRSATPEGVLLKEEAGKVMRLSLPMALLLALVANLVPTFGKVQLPPLPTNDRPPQLPPGA